MGRAAETWEASTVALGGSIVVARKSAATLEIRYTETRRAYHNTSHVSQVVRDALSLADWLELPQDETHLLALAACAHDVVYDADPGADERASAQWARTHLSAAGVDGAAIERVAELVLTTIDHRAPEGDLAAAILLDADLGILGGGGMRYGRYALAVRSEYGQLTAEQWRTGRIEVLRGLLARDPLYVTEPARSRWEWTARRNLAEELERLVQGSRF